MSFIVTMSVLLPSPFHHVCSLTNGPHSLASSSFFFSPCLFDASGRKGSGESSAKPDWKGGRGKSYRKKTQPNTPSIEWRLWKFRNDYIFNSVTVTPTETLRMLIEDAEKWTQAGATSLATVGWSVAATATYIKATIALLSVVL